jgi:hypothetical protein
LVGRADSEGRSGYANVFGFLAMEPSAEVGAIHPKAMPAILTKPEEIDAPEEHRFKARKKAIEVWHSLSVQHWIEFWRKTFRSFVVRHFIRWCAKGIKG